MANRYSSSSDGRIEPRFDSEPEGDLRAPMRETSRAKRKKPAKSAKKAARKTKSGGSWLWRLLRWGFGKIPRMAYWGVVMALWGFIGVLCIFGWYGAKLPNAASWEVPQRPPNVRIVSDDGQLMLNRGVGGTALRLEDMSPYLPQAVIAIEDHRFQSHFGFDPTATCKKPVP